MRKRLTPLFCARPLIAVVALWALSAGFTQPARAAMINGIDCETTEVDAELLQCAGHDLAQNQKRLDDLVAQSLSALPAGAKPLFDQAEKAWVNYRDAACQWNSYDMATNKTSDLIRTTCLADLTSARVEEMEAGLGPTTGSGTPAIPVPSAPSPSTAIAPPLAPPTISPPVGAPLKP